MSSDENKTLRELTRRLMSSDENKTLRELTRRLMSSDENKTLRELIDAKDSSFAILIATLHNKFTFALWVSNH